MNCTGPARQARQFSGVLRHRRGFTLIEALTVIALFAVMLALALPSFNDLIERYRIDSRVRALESTFAFARAEAMRRGANVTIRGVTGCSLSISSDDWSCGWRVVVGSGASLQTLRIEDPDARVSVMSPAGKPTYVFTQYGLPSSSSWGHLTVTPNPGGVSSSNTVILCLSSGGRVRKMKDEVECQANQ